MTKTPESGLKTPLLDRIDSPADMKRLSDAELMSCGPRRSTPSQRPAAIWARVWAWSS